MNILTLKIPEELDDALQAASRSRGLSKSAVVREALEQSLGRHAEGAAAAERWLAEWRGRLAVPPAAPAAKRVARATRPSGRKVQTAQQQVPGARLAHLLAKHLR
ncbi:MAG TPA: CopG family transcriptional regulator [Burkholderiaceae bacterium]